MDWTELGLMTGRSLGLTMFVLFVLGHLLCGKTGGWAKMCTLWNLVIFYLMISPAYFGGDSAISKMWEINLVFQIPFVLIGLYCVLMGGTGPWPFVFYCPSPWGRNAPSYCFVNLCFYVPFAISFCLPDPGVIFGPESAMGLPLFLVEFDETALLFARAWAAATFILCLGPYLFAMPAVKVTKLLTVKYLTDCALFTYAIAFYSVLNLPLAGPLTGVNVVFLAVGIYLSLPSQAGEDILLMA
jgi:hypothetical protein